MFAFLLSFYYYDEIYLIKLNINIIFDIYVIKIYLISIGLKYNVLIIELQYRTLFYIMYAIQLYSQLLVCTFTLMKIIKIYLLYYLLLIKI